MVVPPDISLNLPLVNDWNVNQSLSETSTATHPYFPLTSLVFQALPKFNDSN